MLYDLNGLGEHYSLLNTRWLFIRPLTRCYPAGEIQVTVLTSLSVNTHNCLGTEIELLNSLKLMSRDREDGCATGQPQGVGSEAYLNGTSQGPTPEDARKDGHIRGRSKRFMKHPG
jgi:hypothetical protein